MGKGWTPDFLTRRIDRCYRVASWTRIAEKRARYLALARHYRAMLTATARGRITPMPAPRTTPTPA